MKEYVGQTNVDAILKANQDIAKYANELGKKGASILGDMGAFLFKKRIQDLIDYELRRPKQFEMNLKGICMYNKKDFEGCQKI